MGSGCGADLSPDLLQDIDVGLIGAFAVQARHLQEEGHVLKAPVAQNALEARNADEAVADVLMAVAATGQLHLRVVGVDGDELVEADLLLELTHRQLEALGARYI